MRVLALATTLALALGCFEPESSPSPSPDRVTLASLRQLDARLDADLSRAGGPVPGAFAPLGAPLDVALPITADGALRITARGETITARRLGVGAGSAAYDGALVTHDGDRGLRVVSFRKGLGLEELFVTYDAGERLGYALELPRGVRIERETPTTVALVGDEGVLARVSVPLAWELDGDPIDVRWAVEGTRLLLDVPASAELPAVIDPTWSPGGVPQKLRTRHTATLLPDGRVFVVGGPAGSGADAQTEIYDPFTGTATLGPVLSAGRSQHTATLLLDGRVLVAGGTSGGTSSSSTELFDVATGAVTPGPSMSVARAGHAATLLDDGRVLFVGSGSAELFDPASDAFTDVGAIPTLAPSATLLTDGRVFILGLDTNGVVAHVFDPATSSLTSTGIPTFDAGGSSVTTLRDGRVLAHGGCPCASTGGPPFSASEVEIWDPATGTFSAVGSVQAGRLGHTATLLPDGRVVFIGGDNQPNSADVFDPVTETFARLPDATIDARAGHTSTLLPTGNILVIGGTQATSELFLAGAGVSRATFQPGATMTTGRLAHTATILRDGRVLVAGGELFGPAPLATAELLSADGAAFTTPGDMTVLRKDHAATLLPDGRVLLSGGADAIGTTAFATTEIFEPTTSSFAAGPAMSSPRRHHTSTLLSSGLVLLAGGSDGTNALATAELFDPADGTLTATAAMPVALDGHRAVLLASGKVLLASDGTAVLFDPTTATFALAPSPSTVHAGLALSVLASGRALVWGGDTQAAELFDPAAEEFVFTSEGQTLRREAVMASTALGEVVVTGGYTLTGVLRFPTANTERFDPAGGLGGSFASIDATDSALLSHRATVLKGGALVVTGGTGCFDLCIDLPHANTEVLDATTNAFRPVIATAPSTIEPGAIVSLTGTRLRGLQGSGGQTSSGTSNHPIVVWQPLDRPGVLVGRTTEWTDTTASFVLPATAFTGAGWLRVAVNGMVSEGVLVDIEPAELATPCSFDADCDAGFCADGVCCDSACDADCEACTAALKGSGADGECGPVPPEQSLTDECVVSTGAPCTAGDQCSTGICADGVCCLSACTAQCEACDVAGSVGTCVPVTGAPRGDRPACDATPPEDPCEATVCDGQNRDECAETVGPCGAYACGAAECLEACVTDAECAVGFHCDDGECVAGQCDGSIAVTPAGDEVDCAPYNCRSDGTCKTSCSDVTDCASPSACNFEGRCVPRPPADVDTSCACSLERTSSNGALGVAMLGLLALARRRRARLAAITATAMLALFLAVRAAPAHAQPASSAAPPAASSTPTAPPSSTAPAVTRAPGDGVDKEAAREEAKQRFERGLALVTERSWDAALAEFMESVRLFPTRGARQNVAFCLRELTRYDESLSEYEALLRDYPDMDEKKKKEAQDAVSALRDLVGSIEVDAAEPGATIVIDGKQRGVYPAPAPFRVSAGSHVVRVFLKGYAPFEARVDVPSRQIQRVSVSMVALTESGTLKVTEKNGKALKVFVDQVEVGTTPFEGPLAIGAHVLWLQGEDGLGVAPTAAPIERDRVTALELEAVPLDATLRIEPTPAGALVKIDGVEVGRGTWEGALPSGDHVIDVSTAGYLSQKKPLTLARAQPTTLRVKLELNPDEEPWTLPGEFVIEATGGLNLVPGTFGEPNNGCDGECSASVGLGATALLHVSFEFSFGLAVGITGGWFSAQQSIDGREASVQPVGLPARSGLVDDELSTNGGLVGAHLAYRVGDTVPVTFRVAGGALLAEHRDVRTGRFSLDDGFVYQAGPAIVEEFTPAAAILPEVRVSYKFTEAFEASLGASAIVVIPIETPRWDASRELDAASDGIGAFGEEDLAGPAWFAATPSLGARYAF